MNYRRMKTEKQLPEDQCAKWNAENPNLGITVTYFPVKGRMQWEIRKTSSKAYTLSGHTAVIHLEGKAGCVAIDHCIAGELSVKTDAD